MFCIPCLQARKLCLFSSNHDKILKNAYNQMWNDWMIMLWWYLTLKLTASNLTNSDFWGVAVGQQRNFIIFDKIIINRSKNYGNDDGDEDA